jgi:hypothetical protein
MGSNFLLVAPSFIYSSAPTGWTLPVEASGTKVQERFHYYS